VLPAFLSNSDELYFVEHEYNGILVEAAFSDIQFLKGKGAGGHPTGSAVLSDIAACRYGYKYEYKKQLQRSAYAFNPPSLIRVYISWPHEKIFPKDLPLEILDSGSLVRKEYLEGNLNLLKWPDIRNKLESIEAFIAVLPTV
jgi:homoserine dehydrogenase